MKVILDEKLRRGDAFPDDAEIVLELPPPEDKDFGVCYYYCVNHQERIIFWMDEMELSYMLGEVRGIESMAHVSTSRADCHRRSGYH
jgi:hypothetical protein